MVSHFVLHGMGTAAPWPASRAGRFAHARAAVRAGSFMTVRVLAVGGIASPSLAVAFLVSVRSWTYVRTRASLGCSLSSALGHGPVSWRTCVCLALSPRHRCWLQARLRPLRPSRRAPSAVVFPLAFEKKELCSLGAGPGVGECFLGGHIWWRPTAQGEASASWSWPGVAPSLQRWRGQRPASLHILNAVLNGQDGLVFLSSSGLNEHCPCHLRCALSALWREWSPRLTPLLPSERPLCPSGSALQPCWSLER